MRRVPIDEPSNELLGYSRASLRDERNPYALSNDNDKDEARGMGACDETLNERVISCSWWCTQP